MDRFNVFDAAAEAPRRPALVQGTRTLDYRALADLASQALGWLSERLTPGTAWPEVPVALLATPAVAQVAMAHALIARGIPLVPVHPGLAASERDALVQRVGAPLLVDEKWALDPVPARARTLAAGIHPVVGDAESPLALVQTSGSSGGARLAVLSRRAFTASAEAHAAHLGWQPGDRWLLALPFAHIGGLSILTRCLWARSTVVLAANTASDTGRDRRDSTGVLGSALRSDGISLVSLVPTQLQRLLAAPDWQVPRALRAVLVGGAAVPEGTLAAARARGLPVLPSYGMTETCSQICTRQLSLLDRQSGVGRPLLGVQLAIEDDEILVRGPMLYSGYLHDAQPVPPTAWFHTGDLGRIDGEGSLLVTGRRGDLIITGGENVHPVEVERLLDGVMPSQPFCVFGCDHELWGEQVALAIEGPEDTALVQRVARFAATHLATFQRPRLVVFVDRLPRLGSGKVSRRALKEHPAGGALPVDYTGLR